MPLGPRPFLLSSQMRDACAKAIQTCRKYGKHLGIGGLSAYPNLTVEFVKMGARYVSTGTDLSFLLGAATRKLSKLSNFNCPR
jgi:4-hydroxy-2-oxoheptanedioate aldolase